jgi:hypothetical protein
MVNFMLPSISVLEGPNKTNLQISTLNSYDGAWKYQSKAGGIRIACLNGNILGKIVSSYSAYHNAKLDVAFGAQSMTRMIADFSESDAWFNAMINRKVDSDDVRLMASKFFNVETKDLAEHRPYVVFKTILDGYFLEMGKNAYALYNAFTDYITHKKRSARAQASSLFYDEKQLKSIIDRHAIFGAKV